MGLREQQLAAVAEAHYQWSQDVARRIPFHSEDNAGSRDYNLEHVEMEASGGDFDQFVSGLSSAMPPAGMMGVDTDGG